MNTPRFLSLFVQGNPSLLHHSFLLEKGGHTCLVSGKRFPVGGCVFIRWLYAETIPQLGYEALFLRSLAHRLIDLFDELIRLEQGDVSGYRVYARGLGSGFTSIL